jgi:hypothetical protein
LGQPRRIVQTPLANELLGHVIQPTALPLHGDRSERVDRTRTE